MTEPLCGVDTRLRELQQKLNNTLTRLAANDGNALPPEHIQAIEVLMRQIATDTDAGWAFIARAHAETPCVWSWNAAPKIDVFTANRSQDIIIATLEIHDPVRGKCWYQIDAKGQVAFIVGGE